MDFDYTTETITPDNTGVLTIGGNEGVEVPVGTVGQRPGAPSGGVLRFSTYQNQLEFWDGTNWQQAIDTSVTSDMFAPSGFVTPTTSSTISFNPATQTLAIVPTGSTFRMYIAGTRYTKTAETVTIPNVSGQYFFYYDSSATLQYTTSVTLPFVVPVAAVIYISTPTPTILALSDQRHGISMDYTTIDYLSKTQGVAYVSGLDITGYTLTGNGSLDVDAEISMTDGIIYNADIVVNIANSASPSQPYEQFLDGPAQMAMAYVISTGVFGGSAPTSFPVQQGTSRIQYSNFNGTTYDLTDADEGYYVASWVVASNSYYSPITGLVGLHQSATYQQAIADNTFDDLKAMFGPSSLIGTRPLYCLIFQTSSSYANTPHAALRGIIDYRVHPITGTLDHSALEGLSEDDHPQYVHISNDRTITAQDTYAPVAPQAPWILGANAQGQLVIGLNADQLDGYDSTAFQPADSDLSALAAISSTGVYVITGSGTSTTRSITSSGTTLSISNGNGVAGNINIDMPNVGTPVSDSLVRITTDAQGRVSATSSPTLSDITTALGYTPVNKAGDTMGGVLNMGGYNISNLASPTVSGQAATKGYVDSLSTGLIWQTPALSLDLVSDAGGPPGSPALSDTYIIGTGDNTGAWSGFAVGDVVQYQSTGWQQISTAAIGQKYGISFSTPTVAGGSFTGLDDYIVTITGGTPGAWTYSSTAPVNNWAIQDNNPLAYRYGDSFTYTTSLMQWVQFASNTSITPGAGLYFSSGSIMAVGTVSSSRIVINADDIDLATTSVTPGTYTKLTVDAYGRATVGALINSSDVTTALGYTPQAQNSNLTALSGASSTGIYIITGSGTSAERSLVQPAAGITISNADGVSGNPTFALADDLSAVEGLSTNGLVARTAANTWTTRTIVQPSEGITVTNGDGVSGNPTLALANDLAALEGLTTTGYAVRYGTSQWISRTIAGTTNQISLTNGDGVAGNTILSIATDPVLPGTGSVTVPTGITGQQPGSPTVGMLRFNTTTTKMELYDTAWRNVATETWVVANTVSTFSAGTTGLTPNSATSGAVTLAGTLGATNGGTGQNTYTIGDILYANTTSTLARLADVATGNALISGGTNTAPSWGKIGLTTHVSGILPLANGGTNANLTAVNGGVLYSTATAMGITAAGTSGQLLTSTGAGAPTWSSIAGASYSVNVGPSGSISWVLVSGTLYSGTITHNLNTNNVVVQMADIATNDIVFPDLITVTSANVVTIRVRGNTRTLRVVIIANGAAIAAGGSTPSSVLVQASGTPVSGGPFTTLNFTGYVTAPTGAGGVATINLTPTIAMPVQVNGTPISGGPFTTLNFAGSVVTGSSSSGTSTVTITAPNTNVIRSLTYYATSLDSPNNSDWVVNALAPTVVDPSFGALSVRQFSNASEQGVGLLFPVPTGATNISLRYRGRPQTAPGTAGTLQMRAYIRKIADATTPAAVGSWSAATALTSVTVPTNAFYQTYVYTTTLAALSLVAGNLYQIEFTRNTGVAGNPAVNWLMTELTLTFT